MKKFVLLSFIAAVPAFMTLANSERKTGEIKTDNAVIYYVEQGTGDTTLFFLHGWDINSGYWKDQQNFFSSKYKTIAIDLPGFGKSTSDRKDYTVGKYAGDVIDIINKMNLKNVILIGHSMSGDIILETALQNNNSVIGIVGVDNFKFVGIEETDENIRETNLFLDTLRKDYKNVAPQYAAKYLFSQSTDSSVINRVKTDYINSNPDAAVSSIKNVFNYNEKEKLLNLNFKLYLINSDTRPTNTKGLEKYCKNSFKVFDINGTGHFPMIEKPEEFNHQLQLILNEICS